MLTNRSRITTEYFDLGDPQRIARGTQPSLVPLPAGADEGSSRSLLRAVRPSEMTLERKWSLSVVTVFP